MQRHLTSVCVTLALALTACGGAAAPSSSPPASAAAKPASPAASAGSEKPAASAAAKPASSAQAATSGAAAGKPERDSVKIVYATASGEDTFVNLAVSKGYFQNHGLKADAQFVESNASIAALTAGEAQLDMADGVSAIQAITSGTPLKILGYFDKTSPYMIAALGDIKQPSDLKGKTVAVGKIGDTSDISLRIGLKQIGIDPAKDMTILQVGNSPARWAALSSKQIQAAILDEEAYRKMAEAQGMNVLVSMQRQKLPYVASALVVTDAFSKANPNTVLASLKALIDGTKFFADEKNKNEVLPAMAKELKLEVGSPQLETAYDAYHTRAATDPYPDTAGVQTILDALNSIDPSRYKDVTPAGVIDTSYMDKIRSGA